MYYGEPRPRAPSVGGPPPSAGDGSSPELHELVQAGPPAGGWAAQRASAALAMSACLTLELDRRDGWFSAFAKVLVENQVLDWEALQTLMREVLWPNSVGRQIWAGRDWSSERSARVYEQLWEADSERTMELWQAARQVVP